MTAFIIHPSQHFSPIISITIKANHNLKSSLLPLTSSHLHPNFSHHHWWLNKPIEIVNTSPTSSPNHAQNQHWNKEIANDWNLPPPFELDYSSIYSSVSKNSKSRKQRKPKQVLFHNFWQYFVGTFTICLNELVFMGLFVKKISCIKVQLYLKKWGFKKLFLAK